MVVNGRLAANANNRCVGSLSWRVCWLLGALTRVYRHRGYTEPHASAVSLCVHQWAGSIARLALYSANLISPISTALRRPHDAIYTEQPLPAQRAPRANISEVVPRRFRFRVFGPIASRRVAFPLAPTSQSQSRTDVHRVCHRSHSCILSRQLLASHPFHVRPISRHSNSLSACLLDVTTPQSVRGRSSLASFREENFEISRSPESGEIVSPDKLYRGYPKVGIWPVNKPGTRSDLIKGLRGK